MTDRSRKYARRARLGKLWMVLVGLLFAARYAATPGGPLTEGLSRLGDELGITSALGADAPAAGALRVASWNLQWLSERDGVGPAKRRPQDYERLAKYREQLAADVVAVQEVQSAEALARVFPPDRYQTFLGRLGGRQRVGFAVKKELRVRRFDDLDELAEGGLRSGVDIGVRTRDGELRLLGLHLKAFCTRGALDVEDKGCQRFARQVPIVERWIDDRQRASEPFVVLGDLNRELYAGEEVWTEWDDDDPKGLRLVSAGQGQSPGCWGGRYERFIDHILLGGAVTGWDGADSFRELVYGKSERKKGLSDHCPVYVDLVPPG